MPWFRSPVKLFAYAALFLCVVRLVFPPADNAPQLHSYVHFFDLRVDLTGYGVFEFVAFVFALAALVYYLIQRITKRRPNSAMVQLHFWPCLLFAVLSVALAHWANGIPSSEISNPKIQAFLNAYTWAFVGFLALQIVLAIGAIRSVWPSKNADARTQLTETDATRRI